MEVYVCWSYQWLYGRPHSVGFRLTRLKPRHDTFYHCIWISHYHLTHCLGVRSTSRSLLSFELFGGWCIYSHFWINKKNVNQEKCICVSPDIYANVGHLPLTTAMTLGYSHIWHPVYKGQILFHDHKPNWIQHNDHDATIATVSLARCSLHSYALVLSGKKRQELY